MKRVRGTKMAAGSSLWARRTRDLVPLPFQAGRCREKFKEPTDEVTYHDILPYELLIDDGQSCAKTLERKSLYQLLKLK